MEFQKKTWKDRITEFPTRRTLTKSDGSTEIVTVARAEGVVSQEGDAFNAASMNDLEERIYQANSNLNNSLTALGGFEPVIDESTGKITGYKTTIGGADTVFPFSSELSFEKLYDVSYGMNQTASFDFRDQDDYSGFLIVSLKVDSVSQIVNNGFSGSDIKIIVENGIWWKNTTVSIMRVGYTTRKQTVSIYGSGSGAVLGYFAVYGIKH